MHVPWGFGTNEVDSSCSTGARKVPSHIAWTKYQKFRFQTSWFSNQTLFVPISVWNSKCSLYMSWYGVSPQRPSCKNLHVLQILVTKIANLDGFPQGPAAKKIKQQCRAWRTDEWSLAFSNIPAQWSQHFFSHNPVQQFLKVPLQSSKPSCRYRPAASSLDCIRLAADL